MNKRLVLTYKLVHRTIKLVVLIEIGIAALLDFKHDQWHDGLLLTGIIFILSEINER